MTESEALRELRLQSQVLAHRVVCNRQIEEFVSSALLEQRKKAIDIAIHALEEIQQYRAIGTVDEFKALKEKAEPKEVVINNIPKTSWTKATTKYTCPSCDRVISFNGLNYCSDCGQKFDW